MAYPRKQLKDNEDIVLDMHPHWISLIVPTMWGVLIVGMAIVLFALFDPSGIFLGLISVAAIILLCIFTVFQYLTWLTTEFVLTTDRVIARKGIFAKWAQDIPLERINEVTFSQTIMQRVFGSGSLMIRSASEAPGNNFKFIRNPEDVHNEIYKSMEALQERDADSSARKQAEALRGELGPRRGQAGTSQSGQTAQPTADIPTQIGQLAQLRDQGILTPEEFETKKSELMRRM